MLSLISILLPAFGELNFDMKIHTKNDRVVSQFAPVLDRVWAFLQNFTGSLLYHCYETGGWHYQQIKKIIEYSKIGGLGEVRRNHNALTGLL